jgi:hypothetical protein
MALPQVATRHVEAMAELILANKRGLEKKLCCDPSIPCNTSCNVVLSGNHLDQAMRAQHAPCH